MSEIKYLNDTGVQSVICETKNRLNTKQNIIQYSTMPIADASNLGTIVQFTGITTQNFTNGFFYKCVDNDGTYKWQAISVQSGGSGSSVQSDWNQTDSTADDYIKNKPVATINGKADKVASATANNFAGLDANGNLIDSGKKASDFATSTQGGKADTAVQTIQIGGITQTKTNGVVNLPAYPTSLPASNTTSSYSASGTAPVNGKAVAAALGTLDVASIGGSGKYIQSISETDGKIYAVAANMSSAITPILLYSGVNSEFTIPNFKNYTFLYVVYGGQEVANNKEGSFQGWANVIMPSAINHTNQTTQQNSAIVYPYAASGSATPMYRLGNYYVSGNTIYFRGVMTNGTVYVYGI